MSEKILGWVALVITMVYTCIGLGDQVRTNYVNKSLHGVSLLMMVMLFLTFVSWVAYAWKRREWFIVVSNGTGAAFTAVILIQYGIYGR